MAVWEDKAKARIRAAIRKYQKTFEGAQRENRMEADIGNWVYMMLADVFGYDRVDEITAEYRVRGQFADYAVKLESKLKFFIEVKGPNVKLGPNHLMQVTMYAVKEGIEWVVLTNGLDWQLYHIGKTMPIEEQLVFSCNLADGNRADTVDKLFILTREAMQRDVAKAYWDQKLAVSPANLLRVLYSEEVVEKMRKALRTLTGYRASTDELRNLLESQVVRLDFAGQAKKIGRRTATTRRSARREEDPAPSDAMPAPSSSLVAAEPTTDAPPPTVSPN